MPETEVNDIVSHLFRQEAGKMASVLTRLLGFEHLDEAQDIVQDTLIKALSVWKIKGIPANPSAWLHTVAKRKAIDFMRQKKLHYGIHTEIAESLKSEYTLAPAVNHLFLDEEIEDSQLRMIFACCHPAIPYESQLAFTLRTLCGLSVGEIAQSFLTNEETITKRLYRAREKIRTDRIALEVPTPGDLPGRLEAVLHTIYLLFNEGYNSSARDTLIRDELCQEAIRLCLLLTRNAKTNLPQTNALLALMCFQASRSGARLTTDGEIILLKDQDRKLWNRELIQRGITYLDIASTGDALSAYHIEATIAAYHATADTFENTDWKKIHALYESLAAIKPGPVVELNRAIALGYSHSAHAALSVLLTLKGLEGSYVYHCAVGDFHRQTGDLANAREAYAAALDLARSNVVKDLLQKKIRELSQ